MRTVSLLLLVLGTSCAPVDGEDPIFPDPDTTDDTTDDTTTDTTQPADDPDARPLCKEPVVTVPRIPADLVAWADMVEGSTNRFFGRARIVELEALGEFNLGLTPSEIAANRIERGWNRLRIGNLDGAIADLQAGLVVAQNGAPEWRGRAREILGVTWMRRAEVDNCSFNGGGYACIVPFDPTAQHTKTEGMTNAIAVFTDFLTEDDPDKPSAIWLLNVAHMALGQYPSGVPAQWLVPPEALESEEPFDRWINVAASTDTGGNTISGSSSFDDFDGDGNMDILMSTFDPRLGFRLYLGEGNGRFCEASQQSGMSAVPGSLGFSVADYDNDGDLDVYAPRAAWLTAQGMVRGSLMQNDGFGHFVDVTTAAGMARGMGPSQTSIWADIDGDGWLDLFVGRESVGGDVSAPSSLYVNRRDGTFIDVADAQGVKNQGWVKGATWCDIDEDGDPDLYVSLFNGNNRLFENDRVNHRFREFTGGPPLGPYKGFSAICFDYDQDGLLDIFSAAYHIAQGDNDVLGPDYGRAAEAYVLDILNEPHDFETALLYHNLGGTFEEVSERVGLDDVHATMGSNTGDLDMDGFPDLYYGTGAPDYDALEPNIAYHNAGGQRFNDVTANAALGHLQKGHGVSFGDFDEDGDEDIIAEMGGGFPGDTFPDALFLNPTTGKHGVTLKLVGTASNRDATGARIQVRSPSRTAHYLVSTGSSFGNNSHQVEAAIGADTEILEVEIRWPSGTLETYPALAIDTVYTIQEGTGITESHAWRRMSVPLPEPVTPTP